MKKGFFIVLVFLMTSQLMAQAPLGFNYQGIAREADGNPIAGKEIAIRVSIIDGPQGNSQFSEEHFLITNNFGLFTAVIGNGNGNSTLNSVDWSLGNLWLQIELDPDNSGYMLMGSQQLMSVPYALFAQQSGEGLTPGYGIDVSKGTISNVLPDRPITLTGTGNVQVTGSYPNFTIDGTANTDADPTNEIQSLSKSGNTVSLSNGGGSFTDAVDDADADATNEIQDLRLAGNILTVTKNGTATKIDLSAYLDNTDTQLTEIEVDGYVTNNGYLTSEVDGSISNELQDLSSSALGTNRTINISGGTNTTISIADNDNSTSNETITATSYEANNTIRFVEGGVNNDLPIGTLNANMDANSNRVVNLTDPVDAQDAVTKSFLESESAKDFAISVPISFTSSGAAGDEILDLSGASLDKGGLISGATITILETGVYLVSVQGFSQTALGSGIDILINGAPTAVLKGTNNYVGTYLFDLASTNTVSIVVKFGASVETVNLQISVYKI